MKLWPLDLWGKESEKYVYGLVHRDMKALMKESVIDATGNSRRGDNFDYWVSHLVNAYILHSTPKGYATFLVYLFGINFLNY